MFVFFFSPYISSRTPRIVRSLGSFAFVSEQVGKILRPSNVECVGNRVPRVCDVYWEMFEVAGNETYAHPEPVRL